MKIDKTELVNIIKECITELNEGVNTEGLDENYFAVNKQTNKIVNGWDYHDIDGAELRQYKKDYFINDLIDYELDPKNYTILTKAACIRRGIDPDDDSNWANA